MNKNFKFYAIVWAILIAVFNIITFASPNEFEGMTKFGGAFWVGYVFITVAFLGQLAVSFYAFNTKNMQKFFYKIPLIRISWSGLILTLIFGSVAMYFYEFPKWLGAIICLAIFGFNAISLVKANVAAEIVGEIDDKVKAQTSFIKTLTIDAETLMSRAQNETVKTAAKKVYEAIRYSDPMSNGGLSSIESEIAIKFNQFSNALNSDGDDMNVIAEELIALINDRNQKCKILK